jgi:hypothetical protein
MLATDYALELFDTTRDETAVRFRLMRDLQVTRENAEQAIQQALDIRSKLLLSKHNQRRI